MTSKAYQLDETAITWLDTGGTNLFTGTSLGIGAGRQGAQHDFGTSARVFEFYWRAYMKFATTPVIGEVIQLYWKTSDGTHIDNDDGTGDIAVSAEDKLKNLKLIGSIEVDEASITPEFSNSGILTFESRARYGQPVFWNSTADAFSSTAADHGFILTPIPLQAQDT